jgi:hypothetical protein
VRIATVDNVRDKGEGEHTGVAIGAKPNGSTVKESGPFGRAKVEVLV